MRKVKEILFEKCWNMIETTSTSTVAKVKAALIMKIFNIS